MTSSRRAWSSLLTAALVAAAGCGTGGDGDLGERELLVDVDRLSGRSFEAHGSAVDDGLVCPTGRAHSADFAALDGSLLSVTEFGALREAAIMADPPDVTIGYLLDVELDCADGSGAIRMVVEERNGGGWHITSGTGVYRGLTGSGTLDVERDPSTEDWAPPGGIPHWNHFVGAVAAGSG